MCTRFALASLLAGAMHSWGNVQACTFTAKASEVPLENYAVRIPLSTEGAETECASAAAALEMAMASIQPMGQGKDCLLFKATSSECEKYNLASDALTMSNFTGCPDNKVQLYKSKEVDLTQTAGTQTTVGETAATVWENVAAVGETVHSDLTMQSAERCMATCALWLKNCTHVSIAGEGSSYTCSFHSNPAKGFQVPSTNTYSAITASPLFKAFSLNHTTEGHAATPLAAPPQQVSPLPAPSAHPHPATAPAPTPALSPTPPPAEAPAATPTATAPAPAASGPASAPDDIKEALYDPPGTCPGPVITDVPAGKHEDSLTPPDEALKSNIYDNVVNDDGKFPMPYHPIQVGGEYCVAAGSTSPKVIVGGTVVFKTPDGSCVAPPGNAAGEPCCHIYMWQPNTAGFYYENCSSKLPLHTDGFFYFRTEMPGDESKNGWGPDPEPHIHYDIICEGCAKNDAFPGVNYRYWNKLYPEGLCTLADCGVPGPVHQAEKTTIGAETAYKYHFVLTQVTRTKNSA